MPLVHHELCFGCGRSNLFGLLLEADQGEPGSVSGRCFIKQDHQGPDRGRAHPGIIAAALTEAMAFACGSGAGVGRFEVAITDPAPVGSFLEVSARLDPRGARVVATASVGGAPIASASARFSA